MASDRATALGPESASLSPEERRWLHDKYERLSTEESGLSASRTSYYAAIGTVLLTAFVVAVADLYGRPLILVVMISFLAALGLVISFIWAVLLHRTNDAEKLYREAALRLEENAPPIAGTLPVPVTRRSGRTLEVNLLRPYDAHRRRFDPTQHISWMDRVNPTALTETLPRVFIAIWIGVAVIGWAWYLLGR